MYRPEFPTHNYVELQRSRIQIGDSRSTGWETTNGAAMRPHTQQLNRQSLDTSSLQRTHWTPGDLPAGNVSEYSSRFRDFRNEPTRRPVMSTEDMMKTSIRFGDGTPMASRVLTRESYSGVPPRAGLRDRMVATHFDLTNPSEMQARRESTHQTDFAAPGPTAPIVVATALNQGTGARATFEQMGGFETRSSLMKDSFRPQTTLPSQRTASVTVSGNSITFHGGKTQAWQRTQFNVGDTEKRFSTSMADAHPAPPPVPPSDPALARDRRVQGMRSSVPIGHDFPTVTESNTQANLRPFTGVSPPPLAARTAFVSNHDYRNWNGRSTTTCRESYVPPGRVEIPPPVDHNLQGSSASIGNSAINEKSSLYRESYRPLGRIDNRTDIQAVRDFHQGHHSNSQRGPNEPLETTTNRATYIGCPGGHASEMCNGLRSGNNVVASDPRFSLRQSSMKETFIHHANVKVPNAVDNSLQRSHIQLGGNDAPWSRTQSEYFQWGRYRLPGQPY
jgi:hypothetical protein